MLRSLLIIPFTLLLAIQYSCIKDRPAPAIIQPPSPPPVVPVIPPPPPSISEKKYLALGDSYTIGQGVPPSARYPVQTRDWLIANGVNRMAEPQIIATTGWTTISLQNAIASQNPTGPYDVVSLLIGVNDQYQGFDGAGYETRFRQLLEKSISLANDSPSHVFVISIPDYSVTPFASGSDVDRIRKEIDQFNDINKRVALSFNVQYLDITPSTREAKNNAALIAGDGLHPSGLEYKKWAERLGPLMKAVLQ
jgi:lysophospholipase L1-like esterase